MRIVETSGPMRRIVVVFMAVGILGESGMYKRACSLKSWARNGCGDVTGTYLVQGNITQVACMGNMEQAEIKKQHGGPVDANHRCLVR